MNIHLREVICTSKDGDRFWRMPECYIRGNTIKYLRVPDEVIDKVQEETKSRSDRRPPGVGRGRGRGREDGPKPKGIGRGIDDGGAKGTGGGRGRGGAGGRIAGNRDYGFDDRWRTRPMMHVEGDTSRRLVFATSSKDASGLACPWSDILEHCLLTIPVFKDFRIKFDQLVELARLRGRVDFG
ncbi:unnamed protein product [Ilex paraguariensis]|uniref:U6 snRNA-associated Sm-like protein LSm4 n=1 Tax=Ilex paraguariensis TaxID=185542 RepID=A0ABC8UCK8_9AQUA